MRSSLLFPVLVTALVMGVGAVHASPPPAKDLKGNHLDQTKSKSSASSSSAASSDTKAPPAKSDNGKSASSKSSASNNSPETK